MSFLEWFLEPANPGPVGNVEVDSPEPDDEDPPKKWQIWLAVLVGLVLAGIGMWWAFYDLFQVGIGRAILKLCWLTLYVFASHKITARPDYSNVGWLGGLLNNPFRISDDFNRGLVYLQAFLFPGKLIAYSLILGWILMQRLYKRRRS